MKCNIQFAKAKLFILVEVRVACLAGYTVEREIARFFSVGGREICPEIFMETQGDKTDLSSWPVRLGFLVDKG